MDSGLGVLSARRKTCFGASIARPLACLAALAWAAGCRPENENKPPVLDDEAGQRGPIEVAPGGAISSQPLSTKRAPTGRFVKLSPADTGVDFVSITDTQHPRKYLYPSGFLCGIAASTAMVSTETVTNRRR